MAYGVVYKITNIIKNKIYVGQTIRNPKIRFTEHFRENSYIGKAMRKYGKENFLLETLEECDNAEKLNEREIFWIAKLNCISPDGYNLDCGGKGHKHTQEQKLKISLAIKGRKHTEESKARMSLAQKGKRNSPEAIAKMRATKTGKPLSSEHCAKISQSNKGKKRSKECCAKFSEVKRGKTPFKNLLNEITKHQLSYRGLAKIMHVSKSPLFLKISGKAKFSNNDISKLVEIFGLPAEYLMKRDDEE